MCRWLAYLGEPRLIEQFVYDDPHSLCQQAQHSHKAKLGVHGDGGGLGWYARPPEPALYRRAGPAWSDDNLRELTRVIESPVFFAHVRASTGAPSIEINCHPFRSGRFLFMHNGQIGGFRRLRRRLVARLSDESYDQLAGGTDSELLFQLMVTNGLATDALGAISRSLLEVEQLRRSDGITEPFRATLALTDGSALWALRWSSDHLAPSLFVSEQDTGVLVVSEPLDGEVSRWHAVPPDTLVEVRRDPGPPVVRIHEGFLSSRL